MKEYISSLQVQPQPKPSPLRQEGSFNNIPEQYSNIGFPYITYTAPHRNEPYHYTTRDGNLTWTDPSVCHFLTNVYTLVFVEFLITTGIVASFMKIPVLNAWLVAHFIHVLIGYVIVVILIFTLLHFYPMLLNTPYNFTVVVVFVLATSPVLSSAFIHTNVQTMLAALASLCCLTLTILAIQVKIKLFIRIFQKLHILKDVTFN